MSKLSHSNIFLLLFLENNTMFLNFLKKLRVWFFFKKKKKRFIYFWLPGPSLCTQAFSGCGTWGLLFVASCRLPTEMTALVVEHSL